MGGWRWEVQAGAAASGSGNDGKRNDKVKERYIVYGPAEAGGTARRVLECCCVSAAAFLFRPTCADAKEIIFLSTQGKYSVKIGSKPFEEFRRKELRLTSEFIFRPEKNEDLGKECVKTNCC